MRVTIASRRSDLARIQAYQVGDALRAAHPQIEINYSFHESLGDKNLSDPLWKMPEKGVFTRDFREGLLCGDARQLIEPRIGERVARRADVERDRAAHRDRTRELE